MKEPRYAVMETMNNCSYTQYNEFGSFVIADGMVISCVRKNVLVNMKIG